MTADQVNRQRPQLFRQFTDVEDNEGLIQRYVRATREDATSERARPGNVASQPHGQSRGDFAVHLVEDRVQMRQQRRRGRVGCWVRRDSGRRVRLYERLVKHRTFVDVQDTWGAAGSRTSAQQ